MKIILQYENYIGSPKTAFSNCISTTLAKLELTKTLNLVFLLSVKTLKFDLINQIEEILLRLTIFKSEAFLYLRSFCSSVANNFNVNLSILNVLNEHCKGFGPILWCVKFCHKTLKTRTTTSKIDRL